MRPAENRPTVALVFATQIEAESAMQRLQAKPVDNFSRLFAGRHPGSAQNILILLTGMGPKAAYLAMNSLLNAQPVSKVINPGVAGSLHSHLQIG